MGSALDLSHSRRQSSSGSQSGRSLGELKPHKQHYLLLDCQCRMVMFTSRVMVRMGCHWADTAPMGGSDREWSCFAAAAGERC